KVDRGRKDHWAMYPCPDKIPVIHEPLPGAPAPAPNAPAETVAGRKRTTAEVLETILVRVPPRVLHYPHAPCPDPDRRVATAWELHGDSLFGGALGKPSAGAVAGAAARPVRSAWQFSGTGGPGGEELGLGGTGGPGGGGPGLGGRPGTFGGGGFGGLG